MRVHGFVDEGLGHSSYLIDLGDGTAAVIDPPRFPTAHEQAAAARGCVVAWTLDTHSHADYVTGSPARGPHATRRSSRPAASRLGHAAPPGRRRRHGRARPTPSTLQADGDAGSHPGPPRLRAASRRPAGRAVLRRVADGRHRRTHRPLRRRARPSRWPARCSTRCAASTTLPDDLAVYPTHGAGSFCSAPGRPSAPPPSAASGRTNPLFSVTRRGRVRRAAARRVRHLPGLLRAAARAQPASARAATTRCPASTGSASTTSTAHSPPAPSSSTPARSPRSPPGTSPARLDRAAAACSPAGSAGSSTPTGRSSSSLDDDQDRDELVRQCLDIGYERPRRRARRRHRRLASRRTPRRHASPSSSPPPCTARSSTSARPTSSPPGTSPARATSSSAPSPTTALPDEPLTVMCGHGERAMTGASLLDRPRPRDVAVLDGGPDTGRRPPAAASTPVDDDTGRHRRAGDPARAAGEPRPVLPARRRQRARRRDDRPGTHRPAAARRARCSGSPRSPPRSPSSSRSAP